MTDSGKGAVKTAIERKLQAAFSPSRLAVVDESHLHAGHRHSHPDGESHFRVEIESEAFRGQSRVMRHRRVHEILADELADRVHALALSLKAPGE